MVGQYLQNDGTLDPLEVAMAPEHNEYGQMQMRKRSSKRSHFGFQMLPNRRIRFARKTLQGVTLPTETSSQISMIKGLLARYGPCLESQEGAHQLNEDCFTQKENEFLKLLAKKLTNLRFKYIL